jgi:hypothetical protein
VFSLITFSVRKCIAKFNRTLGGANLRLRPSFPSCARIGDPTLDIMFDGRRLTRREAAQWLADNGFRTAEASLARYASCGGGPAFVKFGRKPLYSEQALKDWVASKTRGPLRSTSELQLASTTTADARRSPA